MRTLSKTKQKTIYELCIETAKQSPCKKMGFSTALYDFRQDRIVGCYNNHPLPETQYVCSGECIRNSIPSRTHSMIGACFHSEEFAMSEALKKGLPLSYCGLFVAGVDINGVPYTKKSIDFTCIRCASAMLLHGFLGIHVWYKDEWRFITSSEAYKVGMNYAMGTLKIVDGVNPQVAEPDDMQSVKVVESDWLKDTYQPCPEPDGWAKRLARRV